MNIINILHPTCSSVPTCVGGLIKMFFKIITAVHELEHNDHSTETRWMMVDDSSRIPDRIYIDVPIYI